MMSKKVLVVVLLAITLLVSLIACDSIGGFSGLGCVSCLDDLGNLGGFGNLTSRDAEADDGDASTGTEEASDSGTPDGTTPDGTTPDGITSEIPGDSEESGFGGAEGNVPLKIEIVEHRILFNGEDISLAELETLLLSYIEHEYIWELHDTHQAVKTVYDDVVELFNKHDIAFREK